jgi:cytochrome c biogenesis protein CcdA
MNALLTAIIFGLLAVSLAWADNKVIRPSEEEMSRNKMIQYFVIGASSGFMLTTVTGYGIFSFFPGGTEAGVDVDTLEFADAGLDSIKIGRPTF